MTCQHIDTDVIVIAMRCRECGAVMQHRPTTDEQRFATVVRQVMQGLLDNNLAAGGDWSEEERRIILGITPCRHYRRERYICECSGGERERCLDCRRVFADPSQFKIGKT